MEPHEVLNKAGWEGAGQAPAPQESATTDVLPPAPKGHWSLLSRIVVAGTLVVMATAVTLHLLLVFLYLAPQNAISRQHAGLIRGYVYPEFDQNWQLFAPNPLQANITVHARAEVQLPNGSRHTTHWASLTTQDINAIKDNPAPSHMNQNLLRQAWDFYTRSHDNNGRPAGLRGELSELYIRRIAAHRLGPQLGGGQVIKIQVYAQNTPIPPPKWSSESGQTQASYQVLPWWPVSKEDFR